MNAISFERERQRQIKALSDAEELVIYRKHFSTLSADLKSLKKRHQKAHKEGLKMRQEVEKL